MPNVKPGESEKAYVSRCIPVVMHEGGHTSTQAAGKCGGMYRSHKKKARKAKKAIRSNKPLEVRG